MTGTEITSQDVIHLTSQDTSQDVFLKNLEVKFSMLIRALPLKYEVENLDKLVTLINKLVNHFLMANGMS